MGEDAQRAVDGWAEHARELRWAQNFHTAFEPSSPAGRWFLGGRLNVSVNCLDRHLPERADVPALLWEGEPGDRRAITYGELHADVVTLTRALRDLGLSSGDRVALYTGWLPEAVVAMLACARIGAVYALLPAVLPADALADRLVDLEPKMVITQDGAWKRGVIMPLKRRCDDALPAVTSVEHTIVIRRGCVEVAQFEGDHWYHDLVVPFQGRAVAVDGDEGSDPDDLGKPEPVEADHPLAIMYIASRRGRPTGIAQRSAGLLLLAKTVHEYGFATQPEDVLWCAVEFSWVVGQTHAIFGPLACGATTVIYEGMLDTPNHARAWDIIERYQVNTLFTTPAIVRSLRSWADSPPGNQVRSIKRIATGGERIDKETIAWLHDDLGQGRATIANVWGLTELASAARVRPWLEDRPEPPDPGLDILDEQDNPVAEGVKGELVLRNPWPGLTLGCHLGQGKFEFDVERGSPLLFRTGDEAYRSAEDNYLITIEGRKDPLISIAGQLVSATEVEEVLEDHPFIHKALVIDQPDRRNGRAVVGCVVLEPGSPAANSTLAAELRTHVHETLGGLATPRAFAFCDILPPWIERDVLRQALWALCARTSVPFLLLSAQQIHNAITTVLAITPRLAVTPRKMS